ncbi:hypothetical protein [Uliginosibacterium gangwonense]|uniref:hypothetical protein n=1 Tax=Uliginosibacterium gangwonense TaxID=392736 RepID=UPI0012F76737|nr:hypothetical protein [Uliginosibacterium gangwonense]
MKNIWGAGIALMLSACASTYSAPAMIAPRVSAPVQVKPAEVLRVSKRVLAGEGFQINDSDLEAGTLITAPKNFRVSTKEADCGSTMGIDYLLDNRTTTRVSYSVIAEDGRVLVTAYVLGEYKLGDAMQDITLTCVSKGELDRWMLSKVLDELGRK